MVSEPVLNFFSPFDIYRKKNKVLVLVQTDKIEQNVIENTYCCDKTWAGWKAEHFH